MQIGIFTKTFQRDDVNGVLDAVVEHGFETVQFNMVSAGLESMPEAIPEEIVMKVRNSLENHNLTLCGLSTTFNIIHPDHIEREKGIRRFRILASKAVYIGSDFLTLCTGTRNTESMWRHHPENYSLEAWQDLLETMPKLLEIAEEFNLRLGIEPEINNVVDSPEKALLLLKEMRSQRLRIIIDPANIFHFKDLVHMDDILKNAFGILGPYISLAHAKDVSYENPPHYGAAGTGVLNYSLYIKLLREIGYKGPLILHGLSEQEVPVSVSYVKSFWI